MRKITQDTWCAIYPFAGILILCAGLLAFRSNVNILELVGVSVVVGIVTGGLLSIPIIIYHLTAKRSKLHAVTFYYAVILGLSWFIHPGLQWELGYDGFIKIMLVGLLVYGSTAIWTLPRPTLVRMLPSALLSLIVLLLLFY